MSAPADGGPPFRRRDRRRGQHERVVDAALEVVEQSLAAMAAQETRPLLDPPPTPYRHRRLGTLDLFPVALGAVGFGSRVPGAVAGGLLDIYRSSGGNTVVTSDSVSGRHGQEVVGAWLASRRARGSMLLGAVVGRERQPGGLAAAPLTAAVEQALVRLGADVIDVLVLAADDRRTPLEETLTAVLALQRSGKVRELVLGEYAPDRLIEARVVAAQRRLPLVTGVHLPYGAGDRGYERRYGPLVAAQQLALLPRHPVVAAAEPTPSRRLRAGRTASATRPRTDQAVAAVAAERQVPPATVALAWLLGRPQVVAPVVVATGPDDVAAAVAATAQHLTRAQTAQIDESALV